MKNNKFWNRFFIILIIFLMFLPQENVNTQNILSFISSKEISNKKNLVKKDFWKNNYANKIIYDRGKIKKIEPYYIFINVNINDDIISYKLDLEYFGLKNLNLLSDKSEQVIRFKAKISKVNNNDEIEGKLIYFN